MTKRVIETQVINNAEISRGIFRMTLDCGSLFGDAEPGQFVNVYLNNGNMLLPRPISICRIEKERLALVYRVVGNGTKELSGYRENDRLKISTPLGQGYYLDKMFETLEKNGSDGRTIALVAGGLGVPPMVELAKSIRKRISSDGNLIAVLGFQDETFLTEELGSFCDEVFTATESGSSGFCGNVIQMMETQKIAADYYLSCGPKPMLRALAKFCGERELPLQVSLEERMGCGYGACVGCTCKTRESEDGESVVRQKKVCKDGPVFFGEEVVWDE